MRFTGVKNLKHNTMELLKESEKEDIIITAYGKPLAVLHHVTEDALSDYLIENDPAFKKGLRMHTQNMLCTEVSLPMPS